MDKEYNPPMQWHSGEYAGDAMRQPHVTLMDHFAGLAMQAAIAKYEGMDDVQLATTAYEIAEQMLKARSEIIGNIHQEREVSNG